MINLDALVTRHSAILGSTGSGKSTTVASLMRAITGLNSAHKYPSARILMLDVHGEYSSALSDVATVFSVDPQPKQERLFVPFWALDTNNLFDS